MPGCALCCTDLQIHFWHAPKAISDFILPTSYLGEPALSTINWQLGTLTLYKAISWKWWLFLQSPMPMEVRCFPPVFPFLAHNTQQQPVLEMCMLWQQVFSCSELLHLSKIQLCQPTCCPAAVVRHSAGSLCEPDNPPLCVKFRCYSVRL